jgi:hypothetical protein
MGQSAQVTKEGMGVEWIGEDRMGKISYNKGVK